MELCGVSYSSLPLLGWREGVRHGGGGRRCRKLTSRFLTIRVPTSTDYFVPMINTHSFLHKLNVLKGSDKSAGTSLGLIAVLWSIEADVTDGQLYVTGDSLSLGCWDPKLAILLSPPMENSNLWTAEVKIPSGTHLKYGYFMKGCKHSVSDIVWRPGPAFSLSVPRTCKIRERIVVRDLWVVSAKEAPPIYCWSTLLDAMSFPYLRKTFSATSAPSLGKYHKVSSSMKGETHAKKLPVNENHVECAVTNDVTRIATKSVLDIYESCQPVEPWLSASSTVSETDASPIIFASDEVEVTDSQPEKFPADENYTECSVTNDNDAKTNAIESDLDIHERNQSLAEFCLLLSSSVSVMNASPVNSVSDQAEMADSTIIKSTLGRKGTKELVGLVQTKKPVSTVILVNSSVCSMQRIAILEDEKLVELLLEPVKYDIQCDHVYLGVVTELVPNMGGAFVDIGISRPALLNIEKWREPFAYPPFCPLMDVSGLNGSIASVQQKNLDDNDFRNDLCADGNIPVPYIIRSAQFAMNVHDVEVGVHDSDSYKRNAHIRNVKYDDDSDYDACFEDDGYTPNVVGHSDEKSKWSHVCPGTKVIVQVIKERLGAKGPILTPYPSLRSRFWVLLSRCNIIGVSTKIHSSERLRLKLIARKLQPPGFGLRVRSVAAGQSFEELQEDLEGLLSTWNAIIEYAQSRAFAAEGGVERAVPAILHSAIGQTLSVVQDYFSDKVKAMIVDSPQTYHEVIDYLQEVAPHLCERVILHGKRTPIFDEYGNGIEEEADNILNKRVPLPNGSYIVIEEKETFVSIDVNGGSRMLGKVNSGNELLYNINLAAAKQIAHELRLRNVGGLILVDFIDMPKQEHRRQLYEEMKKAVMSDRATVTVFELSEHCLMELIRRSVRPSVSSFITERCPCCHATGRIKALTNSSSMLKY